MMHRSTGGSDSMMDHTAVHISFNSTTYSEYLNGNVLQGPPPLRSAPLRAFEHSLVARLPTGIDTIEER